MSGSRGKTLGKFLKISILLWLRMPLPGVFKHFLETKTLLRTLEKPVFACFHGSQRPLLDRSAQLPPPHQFYYIFVRILRTNFLKSGGSGPLHCPPWVRHWLYVNSKVSISCRLVIMHCKRLIASERQWKYRVTVEISE